MKISITWLFWWDFSKKKEKYKRKIPRLYIVLYSEKLGSSLCLNEGLKHDIKLLYILFYCVFNKWRRNCHDSFTNFTDKRLSGNLIYRFGQFMYQQYHLEDCIKPPIILFYIFVSSYWGYAQEHWHVAVCSWSNIDENVLLVRKMCKYLHILSIPELVVIQWYNHWNFIIH